MQGLERMGKRWGKKQESRSLEQGLGALAETPGQWRQAGLGRHGQKPITGDPVPEADLGSGPLKPTSPWSLPPVRSVTDPGQTRSRRARTLSSESAV